MNKILQLLRRENMTAMEVAKELKVSAQLASHYIRHLRDLGDVKVVGDKPVGRHNARAKLWACTKIVEPVKPPKAIIINPPRRNMHTLTRWVGSNPFERLAA